MSGRRRNPRGSGSLLRDEIISAGIALVDETGDPSALTLRGVARATGISAPSIYPHFADRQAVIEAVLAASFAELRGALQAAIAEADGPAAGLLGVGSAYVRFGWQHPARYRLMFAASGFAPDAVASFTLVEDAIRRCVDDGTSASTDPHADAFLLWVALHGIATLEKPSRPEYRRLGPIDRPRVVLELVRRLARLGAPGRVSG